MQRKSSSLKFQIFSTIFIIILGILLHFTFEWSNNNLIVGAFSSVNESVWEHLKLVFFPMLLTLIIGHFYFRNEVPNFICARSLGIIVAILFIPIFFYLYTTILSTNFTFLDISSFFISVLLGEYITYKSIKYNIPCNKKVGILAILFLLVFFIVFTYFPPHLEIFRDPIKNKFGV